MIAAANELPDAGSLERLTERELLELLSSRIMDATELLLELRLRELRHVQDERDAPIGPANERDAPIRTETELGLETRPLGATESGSRGRPGHI